LIKLERIILNSLPVKFVLNKSKKISLPGFQGLSLFQVVRFFIQQINTVGLNERAAAISFNFIMAIPASAIFLFTLVPYLPISKQFTLQILKLTKDITPNQNTYLLINDFLNDFFNRPRNALLSFGFLLAIFYSSNAMMGVIRTFDKSIFEEKRSNFLKKRWKALKLTFILTFLILELY
jgi:membrane protein